MRKYRRYRSRHRNREKKKAVKQILLRILFVLLCIAVFTFLAVLLGEHLKERASHAETLEVTETETDPKTKPDGEKYPDGILSTSDASSLELCAADIDVTLGEPDDISQVIDNLPAVYNAISIRIVRDGQLIYTPKSLLEYFRLSTAAADTQGQNTANQDQPDDPDESGSEKGTDTPSDAASDVYANLLKAIETAKEKNLRVCAIYTTNSSVIGNGDESSAQRMADKTVIEDLLSIGFDEVTVDGIITENDDLTSDALSAIISYLAVLRGEVGLHDIGLQLPSNIYLTTQSAAAVNTISKYADFLTVGIFSGTADSDEAYSLIYDDYYSVRGSFGVYGIRGVILDENSAVASAVYAALKKLSLTGIQFTSYAGELSYVPEGSDTQAADTSAANDNAKRSEDYSGDGNGDGAGGSEE